MENIEAKQDGQDNIELARELIMKYRGRIGELEGKLQSENTKSRAREDALSLKEQPYFGDIDNVVDEVLEYSLAHNITPKEAYCALYAEEKAKKLMNKSEKESKNIAALSSEGNKSPEPEEGVLSGDELWAAKKAGMSLADYLKYKTKG